MRHRLTLLLLPLYGCMPLMLALMVSSNALSGAARQKVFNTSGPVDVIIEFAYDRDSKQALHLLFINRYVNVRAMRVIKQVHDREYKLFTQVMRIREAALELAPSCNVSFRHFAPSDSAMNIDTQRTLYVWDTPDYSSILRTKSGIFLHSRFHLATPWGVLGWPICIGENSDYDKFLAALSQRLSFESAITEATTKAFSSEKDVSSPAGIYAVDGEHMEQPASYTLSAEKRSQKMICHRWQVMVEQYKKEKHGIISKKH